MDDLVGGTLSKVIPQHTHTVSFRWCKRDFLVFDQQYRYVRAKMRKPLDTCRWCKRKFNDGEMMALAQPEKGPNWLLCQPCAGQLIPPESSAGDQRE